MDVGPTGRWLLLAGAWIALSLSGCGEKAARAGRPDVEIGPVAPIDFAFHNDTSGPLYVRWQQMRAPMRIFRDADELAIDPGCALPCAPQCTCKQDCPSPEPLVRRVEAGAELKVTWEATHFVLRSCGQDAGCQCAEMWPATAGDYRVMLGASTGVSGGVPDKDDPNLLHEATLDASAPQCTASAEFELVGGARLTVPFDCE